MRSLTGGEKSGRIGIMRRLTVIRCQERPRWPRGVAPAVTQAGYWRAVFLFVRVKITAETALESQDNA